MHNSAMNVDCDVLVVGAGISGLATAFRLARRGVHVVSIDAAARPGGVIGTERRGGFLYERGPNSVLDTTPLVNELLTEAGILSERVDASAMAAKRYVVRDGKLVALPLSPAAFVTTPLFSGRSKLRLAREPFVARAAAGVEESVTGFVTRRLGSALLDYAVEPFVAGIYAGDPDELSVAAAFPRLHALEQRYGSLIKGQILGARARAKHPERSKRAAGSFSFRSGMQTLIDALARAAGPIRTSARAIGIRRADDGALVVTMERGGATTHMRARAVVLAVPADCAALLVRNVVPDAARALDEIPYAPVASVARGYARAQVAHPLDGFGFLVPRVEKRRILGSLFSSSMFVGRAPPDTVLTTTFIGGRRNPELAFKSDEEIERIAGDELASLVGAAGEPQLSAITRWPRAIPQYTLGHLERVRRAVEVEAALPGLYLCASYRGGVSVGDCIKSAHETAERILATHAAPRKTPGAR